ncbi:PREDICTED: von Willebrand factor-like, partial [Thamnophis sirtalis]|uniref:von Willebrand factor-like n=1 Tax=Thamnophis sirtalis TaxID=35019 RepID=A0A6I9YYG0_9SAUR
MDYPTEGCFCPPGQAILDGACVQEDICSQCISEDGSRHQPLETWIPSTEPCKVCMCLENRTVNCVAQPCPTAKPIDCGPCEVARLQRNSNQCCPVFECICDLVSCQLPPIPHCKDGLQLIQTNPGGCRPDYACVCKKEECEPKPTPICPPHRKLIWVKTQCCDEYRCVCSCNNSTVTCPPGYLSSSVTNDCDCTSTTCIPDQVCVHRNIVYPLGMTWEEGCKECSCTNMKDAVTGLRITECLEKGCSMSCPAGYKYVNREGACCGKCLRTMCQDTPLWSRGDEDIIWH